jgi:hypothetical protein
VVFTLLQVVVRSLLWLLIGLALLVVYPLAPGAALDEAGHRRARIAVRAGRGRAAAGRACAGC